MKSKSMPISVGITVALAVLATGAAISAQDRYTAMPNGLSFSEFKGYENWRVILVMAEKRDDPGEPAMIDAYKAGIPGTANPRQRQDGEDPWTAKRTRRRLTTTRGGALT
jgi:hypothetical protein